MTDPDVWEKVSYQSFRVKMPQKGPKMRFKKKQKKPDLISVSRLIWSQNEPKMKFFRLYQNFWNFSDFLLEVLVAQWLSQNDSFAEEIVLKFNGIKWMLRRRKFYGKFFHELQQREIKKLTQIIFAEKILYYEKREEKRDLKRKEHLKLYNKSMHLILLGFLHKVLKE